MKAKILLDDPLGRFKTGEIGEVLQNDFSEKYDYKVRLPGTSNVDNFMGHWPIGAVRIFYLYAGEVELLDDVEVGKNEIAKQ